MSACTLCSLNIGEKAVINAINADDSVCKRMQAMGIRAGREVCLVRMPVPGQDMAEQDPATEE